MFLPLASPLKFSQSEFISLLFSGILGTSILSPRPLVSLSGLGPRVSQKWNLLLRSCLVRICHLLPELSTISVCSTELAPSAPQICPLLGLCSRAEPSPQAKSSTDKGEKAIQFHRHLQRGWHRGTKPPPKRPTAPCDGVRWEASMSIITCRGAWAVLGAGAWRRLWLLLSLLFLTPLQGQPPASQNQWYLPPPTLCAMCMPFRAGTGCRLPQEPIPASLGTIIQEDVTYSPSLPQESRMAFAQSTAADLSLTA